MKKQEIISQSYNDAINKGFSDFLDISATSENTDVKIDQSKLVAEIEKSWLNTEIPEINSTPRQYIASVSSLDELIEFFIDFAAISDVGVPELVIDRLKEYGLEAAEKLLGIVTDWFSNNDSDRVLVSSEALLTLGIMKYPECKKTLIDLLIRGSEFELITESLVTAVIEYGSSIVEDLKNTFDTTEDEEARERLLVCIAGIGMEHKSDEIFYFLKAAFRGISNLELIVEIFGDYGDGRAIPLLRGYIFKNLKQMDKTTFNYMRAVIKKLGGEIDDIIYEQ